MIFHCTNCCYDFEAESLPIRCPDCGKKTVREATEKEKADYYALQHQVRNEDWGPVVGVVKEDI